MLENINRIMTDYFIFRLLLISKKLILFNIFLYFRISKEYIEIVVSCIPDYISVFQFSSILIECLETKECTISVKICLHLK